IAARRPNSGDRSKFAVVAMKSNGARDVDIRKTVAVGEAERFVRIKIATHTLEPATGQRGLACVHQRDGPRLDIALMIGDAVLRGLNGYIGMMQHKIHKLFFYHIPFETKADYEPAQPVMREKLHDMPQDRTTADLDHRLGPHRRFF